MINILAIESSCDETSAAIISNRRILANVVASQQDVHQHYGGVVPELASRAHQVNIIPVVEQAFLQANIQKEKLNAIAFTQGPGLLGSLLISNSFAKVASLVLKVPLIAVNHMHAHILSHFIEEPMPKFPFLCLVVSGGHTQIAQMDNHLEIKLLGQTLDDAVGEAFDKIAKNLGLPYPGGPLIDKFAALGNENAYKFPKAKISNLDFSFSGIKTAVLYFIREKLQFDAQFVEHNLNDICASVQKCLIEMLMEKLVLASEQTGIKEVAIAGGVSANSVLRKTIKLVGEKLKWNVYIPDFQYCTDNAAMIAITAHYKYVANQFTGLNTMPNPRLMFGN